MSQSRGRAARSAAARAVDRPGAFRFAARAAPASGSARFRRADSPALSDQWRHRPRASEAAPQEYRGTGSPRALAGRPATRWFDPALADAHRVLVQALGDLDEQPGQQVAIGFDVAELGEHFLDLVLKIVVPALDLLVQRLRFLGQAVGHVALELAQLVRHCAKPPFQRLVMLVQRPLDLLVGICAQVFLFAELAHERLHLLRLIGPTITSSAVLLLLGRLRRPLGRRAKRAALTGRAYQPKKSVLQPRVIRPRVAGPRYLEMTFGNFV